MSSLWTPGGERPVSRPGEEQRGQERERPPTSGPPPSGAGGPPGGEPDGGAGEQDDAELRERMTELRQQLADTPARTVIANHCYGMFELAALHLSLDPPKLDQARLAIDALALLVEGLGSRLGEEEANLREGLRQLRLAFVQLGGTATADETTERPGPEGGTPASGGTGD